MTSPPRRRRPEPVSVSRRLVRPAAIGIALVGLLAAAGCGGGDENAAAPPPPAPPPKPQVAAKPAVTTIDDLRAQLGIDDRVILDESAAPASTEARRAVLEFFDAFVRGRDTQLRPMLAAGDQPYLDLMVELGTFTPVTEAIETVDLVAGSSPDGRPAILGMYVRDNVDEYQMWYYDVDGGLTTFQAAPTPPGIVQRLSGPIDEYVQRWHEILEEEMLLATQPDEDFQLDVNLDESEGGGSDSATGSGPSASPGGGGGRRHQPARRRRPPGIPG